jgi:hypothetical protein
LRHFESGRRPTIAQKNPKGGCIIIEIDSAPFWKRLHLLGPALACPGLKLEMDGPSFGPSNPEHKVSPKMIPALKNTRLLLSQEKGVILVESKVRATRTAPIEVIYTVTTYWTPTRFYSGCDLNAAEKAFELAVARAPQRIR